jgi:DNA polymerase-4
MALKLCPQAKVIKGDMERYSIVTYGDRSNSRKNRLLPKIDEFYLDITGMDRFMVVTNGRMNSHKGSERNRFTDKFALSINKTVSKIGTGETKGHLDIPENQVRAFLNPLSKKSLWWAM